ncbi:BsaA family SipW-dependent biofilm matrix protein [Clostridium perfringens]
MKSIKNNLWAVLGLSVMFVIGTTLAIWYQSIQHTNHLGADTIKADVIENYTPSEPDGTVTKKVSFKNSGSTDVFVRVAYVETWEKEDQNNEKVILNNKLNETDIATKNWTNDFYTDWSDGGDGWLYYNYILKAGESTQEILNSVTFPDYAQAEYKNYGDAEYSLYFKVEMLQASTGDATLNRDEVNTEASQTVFGKLPFVNYNSNTVTWK